MSDGYIATYLAAHPKQTGILFALLLLVTQAGTVAANDGGYIGP